MIQKKLAIMACVPALLITITACSANDAGNREVIKKPRKTITVIDGAGQTTDVPELTIGALSKYEKTEIYGWLGDGKMIVAKDNEALDKMKLEELSASYPRNLYVYDPNAKSYEPLKEKENVFMGGAQLSPDGKHLIYQEYSLGDPVYYVMNLESKESFALSGEPIGGAVSARWADDGTIIGASYAGGAYKATTDGKISAHADLKEESLVIVAKLGDTIFYNTGADGSLKALNLTTKETKELGLESVGDLIPSPDGTKLLAMQYGATAAKLVLCDLDGGNAQTIAEGIDLGGVSWSPDQRMIAYSMKADASASQVKGLYVHDLLIGESTPIATNIENVYMTTWSPSGKELSYTEAKGGYSDSSIIEIDARE